jgi:hypothetical protein
MSEKCLCLLCDRSAVRSEYRGKNQEENTVSGWKYDECAGGCKSYALEDDVHSHIELFVKSPEGRRKIADFVKKEYCNRTSQGEPFFPITIDDLRMLGLKKR